MRLANLNLATMADGYGLASNMMLEIEGGAIAGYRAMPDRLPDGAIDCGGRLATPGLIDCHTHLVYGGNRADEFEKRLNGVSYAEIAEAGGGILATVRATRAASEEALTESALTRLDGLIAEGVTTVEIKSGYGLDTATELKMLRVARALARERPVDVVTSFLGAHAIPPEYKDARARYVQLVCFAAG